VDVDIDAAPTDTSVATEQNYDTVRNIAPAYRSDISCGIDAFANMLALGACPLNTQRWTAPGFFNASSPFAAFDGGFSLAYQLLTKGTGRGDVDPAIHNSKLGSFLASNLYAFPAMNTDPNPGFAGFLRPFFSPCTTFFGDPLLYCDSSPTPTATDYSNFFKQVTARGWWQSNYQPCNGLSNCVSPGMQFSVLGQSNFTTAPARTMRYYVDQCDAWTAFGGSAEFCAASNYISTWRARLAQLNTFLAKYRSSLPAWMAFGELTWTTGAYVIALSPDTGFANPLRVNHCMGPCGGNNTREGYTFFDGPSCTTFHCPVTGDSCPPPGEPEWRCDPEYNDICKHLANEIGGNCAGTRCHLQNLAIPVGFSGRGPSARATCGNGTLDWTTGRCICDPGWTLDTSHQCLEKTYYACRDTDSTFNCSGHGTCNPSTGQCVCATGFATTGVDGRPCATTLLRNCTDGTRNCSNGRGFCDAFTGQCVCASGSYWAFTGRDCSGFAITSGETCLHGGQWVSPPDPIPPSCNCTAGWTGRLCETPLCPLNLLTGTPCGPGTCINDSTAWPQGQRSASRLGTCRCPSNYLGPACEYSVDAGCVGDGPVCGDHGTCIVDFPLNSTTAGATPRRLAHCECREPFLPPYCKYTRCDDPALQKPHCNNDASGGTCIDKYNNGSWACSCPAVRTLSSAGVYVGSRCEIDVTQACGWKGSGDKYSLCDENGACTKLNATSYGCVCKPGFVDQFCQNRFCPFPCLYGKCTPTSGNQYICLCYGVMTNPTSPGSGSIDPSQPCSVLNPNKGCAPSLVVDQYGPRIGLAAPDGLSCYCNDTRFDRDCRTRLCPGTDPTNTTASVCGPDYPKATMLNKYVETSTGNMYFKGTDAKTGTTTKAPIKVCGSDKTCTCGGPYALDPTTGACAPIYNVNHTSLIALAWAGGVNPVTVPYKGCEPGWDPATNCFSPTCRNGATPSGSNGCICPPGFTGSDCSVDLCVAPRGTRVGVNCSCAPGFSGSYCQLSSCANGGSWDSSTFLCSCPPAFNGTNCTSSTCGPLGTPLSTTGQCNCSTNTTFTPPLGCVPNPQPACLNGGLAQNYTCRCPLGFVGALCERKMCGANGVYNRSSGTCNCTGLWRVNALDNLNCTLAIVDCRLPIADYRLLSPGTWSTCHPGGVPAAPPLTGCACGVGYQPLPPTFGQCVKQCSGHGTYDSARKTCLCATGFAGVACESTAVFYNATGVLNGTSTDFTQVPAAPAGLANNVSAPANQTLPGTTDPTGNCPV
jgi:hypothetical protein